jgi:hypothetical protein
MKRSVLYLSITLVSLILFACGAAPENETERTGPAEAASDSAPDPSGTWTGEGGPSERERNAVILNLTWDGSKLSGTINPGQQPIELTNTSFDPQTGDVKMEADVEARGGLMVHYKIEGKVQGNRMTGNWSHNQGREGDFVVTRS